MGRSKKAKRKTRPKISKSESDIALRRAVKKTKRKFGVDQLLEKVDECMQQFDIEAAKMFCERAVQIEPDNPKVLEAVGNLFMETNDTEKAKQCYGRAITLHPEKGPNVYLNLAQISEGQEAVQYFNRGIELLLKERETKKGKGDNSNTENHDKINEDRMYITKISSAYCSIAEVFLTDLCFEDGAESSCKMAIEKALEFDDSNFEAYQVYANFLLSANKREQSKEMLHKSMSFWFKPFDDEKEETAVDDDDNENEEAPPFPLRLAAAKLLIEHEEYNTAIQVLEQLLDEDDEEVQLWYLTGTCYFMLHQSMKNGEQKDKNGSFELPAEAVTSGEGISNGASKTTGNGEVLSESEDGDSSEEMAEDNGTEPGTRTEKEGLEMPGDGKDEDRDAAVENFTKALELAVKLGVEDEEMYCDIISMVKELGYSGDEPQFDLKHIKSTVKTKNAQQMSAALGAVGGRMDGGGQGDEDHNDTDDTLELLEALEKGRDSGDGAGPSTSHCDIYEEQMEQ